MQIQYKHDPVDRLMADAWNRTFYYTYDAAGNRSHFVDGIRPTTATDYVYNSLQQLNRTGFVDGQVPGTATEYAYNNLNQLTRKTVDGTTHTYFDYTADGNMASWHGTLAPAYLNWRPKQHPGQHSVDSRRGVCGV